MISARTLGSAGGTQNASLYFGGQGPASPSPISLLGACTEAYDGTSWSADDAMTSARSGTAGSGVTTAAWAAGGADDSAIRAFTEVYTETSTINTSDACCLPGAWSVGGSLITARRGLGGGGSQNAGIVYGGTNGPGNAPQTHPTCLLYTSPSPRDRQKSRMPSSA